MTHHQQRICQAGALGEVLGGFIAQKQVQLLDLAEALGIGVPAVSG